MGSYDGHRSEFLPAPRQRPGGSDGGCRRPNDLDMTSQSKEYLYPARSFIHKLLLNEVRDQVVLGLWTCIGYEYLNISSGADSRFMSARCVSTRRIWSLGTTGTTAARPPGSRQIPAELLPILDTGGQTGPTPLRRLARNAARRTSVGEPEGREGATRNPPVGLRLEASPQG